MNPDEIDCKKDDHKFNHWNTKFNRTGTKFEYVKGGSQYKVVLTKDENIENAKLSVENLELIAIFNPVYSLNFDLLTEESNARAQINVSNVASDGSHLTEDDILFGEDNKSFKLMNFELKYSKETGKQEIGSEILFTFV